ncbi:MAG: hypothetical protein EZS28_040736 [Streblomastix strix]|uniref:Uncharacterized protein n=1 Tax=Streblomastix strix TaxID=222440 RepID=A0A5J4TZM6_9EUKA|nr:MAG: hypothetical protein EZS28_040736 [Streblomastix strix]
MIAILLVAAVLAESFVKKISPNVSNFVSPESYHLRIKYGDAILPSNVLISAISFHALQPTFSIIPLVRSFSSLGNSLHIYISPRVGIRSFGGPEVRQGDQGITNHQSVSEWDKDNNWLPPSLLISPLYLVTQFNFSLSWPGLLVNYLVMSFTLVEDAKIQYCQTVREFQE